MQEWLVFAATKAIMIIHSMALVIITVGSVVAFITSLPAMFNWSGSAQELEQIWLRFARWLVAGLTFQLAADIIETSIVPTWQDIGQVAAIAVIRTFLDFFLVRDLAKVRAPK
jgi:uncharacterized membrane protein